MATRSKEEKKATKIAAVRVWEEAATVNIGSAAILALSKVSRSTMC